jgi:cytochrome c peroxidase
MVKTSGSRHASIGGAVLLFTCAQMGSACGLHPAEDIDQPAAAVNPTGTAWSATTGASQASAEMNPRLLRRFSAVRAVLAVDPTSVSDSRVMLGRMLFHDKRLSRNQDISCNTCHRLEAYGVDGLKTSVGHRGNKVRRNAPTVINAAGQTMQFWDGRAASVEAQVRGPLMNASEMAMPSAAAVERMLRSVPGYLEPFRRAFPGDADPVTFENVGRAIGAFERRLSTPGPWDRYLSGDKDALTAAEKGGLKVFTNIGCMVCHTGEMLGGSFQKAGIVEPWPNQTDLGRQEITRIDADRLVFKVPTLRNVDRTAPYFHDGSAATLPEAVRVMGKYQLGLDLENGEVVAIVAWLKSLTGPLPRDLIAAPPLPPSGRGTPAPDPT